MLVELGLVEQRCRAVLEVLNDGATVTDVACRNGVARQTVHDWLRAYANGGMAALVDRSSKPARCPHQMPAAVEARIVELRVTHPAWGPRTILHRLGLEGVDPLPGRSSVYRALVRHGLVDPKRRKRRRSDYKRWERSRSMELWQMDVVGRIHLADGTELSAVTGIDDHSRFCVCARLVARATAKPVCDALAEAMRTHGVPDQILTDNGKVFTARFGKGPGPVAFDRICADNGIRHLLTAPHSPTTTGLPPVGSTSAVVRPASLIRSTSHSAARAMSGRCSDLALTLGIRRNSESSSSHASCTEANLLDRERRAPNPRGGATRPPSVTLARADARVCGATVPKPCRSERGGGDPTDGVPPQAYATSRSVCESASARSFFRLWFSICRMRSRVTLKVRPTSSSVRGCWPSRP